MFTRTRERVVSLVSGQNTSSTSKVLSTESPLCKACRTALDLWGSEKDKAKAGDGRPSRGNPETLLLLVESSLADRVATGCSLCTMIYDSFEGETGSWWGATFRKLERDESEKWGYVRTWRQGGPPNDKYRDTDISIRRFQPQVEMHFSVRLHRVDEKQCTACSRGTPHDVVTRNPPPWELMKTWLKDCIETHNGACNFLPSDFLPSRLLHVGTLSEPRLSLQLRDEIPTGTQYLTLSHCWGPFVPMRLLLESLEEFRRFIPAEGLSRTFQDAIHATRKLGMEHIWIDSLCIIQNSVKDWQKEAALMGQVYASAVCNLAATAAREGTQGLFLDKFSPPQVVIDIDRSRDLWHLIENPSNIVGDRLNFAPLNWRGWVFQERFLSTRVIHFGRSRVYWECGKKTCCEVPGKAIDKDLVSNSWTNQSKSFWQSILLDPETVDKDKAVKMWMAIIDHYSSHSNFTFVTDKLVAIGGLASRVQKSIQCRYFAGVWEHNLLPQLMWDVGEGGSDGSLAEAPFVAPSWSWASVNVPISRYMESKVNYKAWAAVEIRNVDVELVTDDNFGQVKGGSLYLLGRLGMVEDIDDKLLGDGESRLPGITVRMDRKGNTSRGHKRQGYLLVVEVQRADGIFEGAGLVLGSVDDSKNLGSKSVFRRLGFFQFWFGKGKEDTIAKIEDEFDGTALAGELEVGSERGGKRHYLITII